MEQVSKHAGTVRDKNILSLTATQFFSALGDTGFRTLVLIIIMVPGMPEEAAIVPIALAQISFFLPYIFLAPLVGVLSDSSSKKYVLAGASFMRGLLLGLVFLFYVPHPEYHLFLYLIIFYTGTMAATYSPSKYGIIPELTPTKRLVVVNGLVEAGTLSAILLGQLGMGVVADIAGIWKEVPGQALAVIHQPGFLFAVYLIVGVFMISAIMAQLLPKSPPFGMSKEDEDGPNIWDEFSDDDSEDHLPASTFWKEYFPGPVRLVIYYLTLPLRYTLYYAFKLPILIIKVITPTKLSRFTKRFFARPWKKYSHVLEEIHHRVPLRRAILGIALFWSIAAGLNVLFFPFGQKYLLLGNWTAKTALFLMLMVGIVIGSSIVGFLPRSDELKYSRPSGILMGAFVIMFSFSHIISDVLFGANTYFYCTNFLHGPIQGLMDSMSTIPGDYYVPTVLSLSCRAFTGYFFLVMIGVMAGFFIIPMNAAIQKHADRDQVSRAVAASNLVNNMGMIFCNGLIMGLKIGLEGAGVQHMIIWLLIAVGIILIYFGGATDWSEDQKISAAKKTVVEGEG